MRRLGRGKGKKKSRSWNWGTLELTSNDEKIMKDIYRVSSEGQTNWNFIMKDTCNS